MKPPGQRRFVLSSVRRRVAYVPLRSCFNLSPSLALAALINQLAHPRLEAAPRQLAAWKVFVDLSRLAGCFLQNYGNVGDAIGVRCTQAFFYRCFSMLCII